MTRRYDVAAHEAAHLVVGLAVGMKFTRAVLGDRPLHGDWREYGAVWFDTRRDTATGQALMIAAGCAWDRSLCEESEGDYALLRGMRYSKREVGQLVLASSAILMARMVIHSRVTRALWERDLTWRDVPKLVEGERLE